MFIIFYLSEIFVYSFLATTSQRNRTKRSNIYNLVNITFQNKIQFRETHKEYPKVLIRVGWI
jgi:hypothetical protein